MHPQRQSLRTSIPSPSCALELETGIGEEGSSAPFTSCAAEAHINSTLHTDVGTVEQPHELLGKMNAEVELQRGHTRTLISPTTILSSKRNLDLAPLHT